YPVRPSANAPSALWDSWRTPRAAVGRISTSSESPWHRAPSVRRPPPNPPPRYRFPAAIAPTASNQGRPSQPTEPRPFDYPSGESYHMFDLSLEMLRVVEDAAVA